jgi:hypothetical protein
MMIQVTTSHYQTVSDFLLNDVVTIISMNDVLNVVTLKIEFYNFMDVPFSVPGVLPGR